MFTPYNLGNLIFGFELFIGEFLFLFSFEKRKNFLLRILLYGLLFLIFSYFYPMPENIRFTYWFLILRFLLMFFFSTFCYSRIFKISYSGILSLCGDGYATQHFSYQATQAISKTTLFEGIFQQGYSRIYLLESIFFPLFYLLLYFLFARKAKKQSGNYTYDIRFDLVAIFILFICVILNRLTRNYDDDIVNLSTSFYAMTCCLSALIIQVYLGRAIALSNEKAIIKKLWEEDKKNYEISKEKLESINIKAHDLKHTLLVCKGNLPDEEIRSMQNVLDDYEQVFSTGNESIDVILNEKISMCRKNSITLDFLGDGTLLDGMDVIDIYSMFSNIIDNAIEALKKIDNPDRKILSINLEKKGNMAFIISRNFYDGNLSTLNGELLTTKENKDESHGYGIKSIRRIAHLYNGDIVIKTTGEIFSLTIFIDTNK